MPAVSNRRYRSPNFTDNEVELLWDILEKHKHVIENKRNDGATIDQKKKTWRQVMKEFNSTTDGFMRTIKSLQQNYKNLKKKIKKQEYSKTVKTPVERFTPINNIEEYITSSDGLEQYASSTEDSTEVCQEILIDILNEADVQEGETKINVLCENPLDKEPADPLKENPESVVIFPNETKLKNSLHPLLTHEGKPQSKGKKTGSEYLNILTSQRNLLRIQLIAEQEKLEHSRILRKMEIEDARKKYQHNEFIRKLQKEKICKLRTES